MKKKEADAEERAFGSDTMQKGMKSLYVIE